jgi:hypothetical protein
VLGSAVLPPPEERKHVATAIGAARAQKEGKREQPTLSIMLGWRGEPG